MKERYTQILRMQHCLLGLVEHVVTVRRIGNMYNCRILTNGEINQEARCNKEDIGYTCRSLLRWEDKCGNYSDFATAARERLNKRK